MDADISVKKLYEKYGSRLTYGDIRHSKQNGRDCYDIYDQNGYLVCEDGENCQLISSGATTVTLKNETDVFFILSKEEMENAIPKAA